MRAVALLLLLLLSLPLMARAPQRAPRLDRPPRLPGYGPPDPTQHEGEFTFARLRYGSYGYRRGGSWTTDWPKADEQFIYGLRGWARSLLAISDEPTTVSMTDDELFKYPFIYVVEPGFMELSAEDAAKLREYLTRGGFLMLDDFWGEREWQNVQEQMRKIFPEYSIQELPMDHPIFHCYFDLNEVVQVPQVGQWVYYGITHEKGGVVPHYKGILDDRGRVLVFIAQNADNGDAWEWIDEPRYPLKYGLAAYRLGMNLIVYSMTH